MALKKPSDYFKKNEEICSIDNGIQKNVNNSEIETFSEAFLAFKNNLSKIELLSDFSETLDNYRINIEKVNYLSDKITDIQEEVGNLLKREDLDRAMMSQLLVVEHSIRDVQNRVEGINEKNLTEIRLDVSNLTNNVIEFLDNDVPKYKRLLVDSELRSSNRYEELEESVNTTLEGIGEFVESKYEELTKTLTGINEKSLSGILEDFKVLENNIIIFRNEEIPKYKGFIVETERNVEHKLNQFDDKLQSSLSLIDEKYSNLENNYTYLENNFVNNDKFLELENNFSNLQKNEIPKYKGFIIQNEKKLEAKIGEFENNLNQSIFNIMEKLSLVQGEKTDLVNVVNEKIKTIKSFGDKVKEQLSLNENYKKHLVKKVERLEIEIVRNESHIKAQNQNIEKIKDEVVSAVRKLNFEDIEEKNYELSKKVAYLEEIFEKFNENNILTENSINENLLVEPPSEKNKDPVTPLDQNYVTLDQLQNHYRLFINRIQQQLATIGGGGETRLRYLDDIVGIATNPGAYDNKYLKYNHSLGKFEFASVDVSSDSWEGSDLGPYTLGLVGIGTTNLISQISVGSVYGLDTSVIGITTTDTSTINMFPSNIFRSARFQVQISQGTDYQTTDLLLIHNGTTANLIEYGSIVTGDYLANFSSIIVVNEALLQINMTRGDYAQIKVLSQKITI